MNIPGRRSEYAPDLDALLAGRIAPGDEGLAALLTTMRSSIALEVPTPSPALAQMLAEGVPALSTAPAPSRRGVSWGRRAAVGAAALLVPLLGAGAANALPAPVQEAVADAVSALSPFELPRPDAAPFAPAGRGGQLTPSAPAPALPGPAGPAPAGPAPADPDPALDEASGADDERSVPGSQEDQRDPVRDEDGREEIEESRTETPETREEEVPETETPDTETPDAPRAEPGPGEDEGEEPEPAETESPDADESSSDPEDPEDTTPSESDESAEGDASDEDAPETSDESGEGEESRGDEEGALTESSEPVSETGSED